MDVFWTLGIIFPNIIVNYMLFRFMEQMYIERYSKKVYVVLYIIVVIFQSAVTFLQVPFLSLVTFIVIAGGMTAAAYSSPDKNKILYTMIYVVYLVFIDLVIVPVYARMTGITVAATVENNISFFVTGIVSSIIGLCSYKFIIQLMVKRNVAALTKGQEVFVFLLGFFELGSVYGLSQLNSYYREENNILIIWIFTGFLLIDIYIIILFESVSMNNELKLKNLLLEQNELLNARYYDELEERNDKYRKIMHDIRKHIYVIQHSEKNDNEYCQQLLDYIDMQGDTYKCTNKILNVILNDKIRVCRNKGIEFNIFMDDADLEFLKKIDITIIFSNLLDNAIEACSIVENEPKYINFEMKVIQNNIVVIISNSCTEITELSRKGTSYKFGHMGLGLVNVRATLQKYGASLTTEMEGNKYTAKFILFAADQTK